MLNWALLFCILCYNLVAIAFGYTFTIANSTGQWTMSENYDDRERAVGAATVP